ncbi:8464_t:CDS:2, partial [Scutellospora calospora]
HKLCGIARIEIIRAKNLRQADTWFGGGSSDPYVRITNISTSLVFGQSRIIYCNCNPIWREVFYIPIYDIREKFNLQVFDYNAYFKHSFLGFYILDLKSIIKELPDGSLKGKQLNLDANLTYKGSSRGKLSFSADFFSLSEFDNDSEIITTTNVANKHLYLITTYQLECGCFELTDSLAKLFNFSSKDDLIKAFSAHVQNDKEVLNLDHNIWVTVLVTSFLKALMWDKCREWLNIYNSAESWLSETILDIDVEERLYDYSNKFVIKRFEVTKWVDDDQKRSLGLISISKKPITRRYVTIRIVRRFITYQNESGCFELTTQLAESLGFNSIEEAKQHYETHFSSQSPRIAQLDAHVWNTAILIWYLRYVLVDFRSEWAEVHPKAYDWLCEQVKDDKAREELLEAAKIFVVKRFEVDQSAIKEDKTFKIKAKDSRSRGIDFEVDHFSHNDEVIGIIKIIVKCAKDLRESDSWFNISNPDPYIRIVNAAGNEIARSSVNHGTVNPEWNEIYFVSIHSPGEKISFEIFDENLFIADKPLGIYVLDTSILVKNEESKCINDWFPLQIGNKPVKGKLNLEYQLFPTSFTDGEKFVFTKDSITAQHLYILISSRKANRSFEFSDKLARFFNYKSCKELKEGFTKHISSNKDILNCDLTILSTALTITYFKVLCWKYYGEWKRIIEDSEVWLSKEINNIEIENQLYDLCKKFIYNRFNINIKNLDKAQLEIIDTAKQTIITRKIITIRYIRTLISHQNKDGCIDLNEKVADYYGFKNVDEFKQHLEKFFKTERVTKIHYNVWVTACTIWYLRLVAVDHRNEWISNYEKLSEWLTKQCNGDNELENEVMGCAREFIASRYEVDNGAIEADNSFITAVKTKEIARKEEANKTKAKSFFGGIYEAAAKLGDQIEDVLTFNKDDHDDHEKAEALIIVEESATPEKCKEIISDQKEDGCIELSDLVCNELDVPKEEIIRTIQKKITNIKLKSPEFSSSIKTAINIAYLKKAASQYKGEWEDKYNKACEYLSKQINDADAEKELLECAGNYVVENCTKKVIKNKKRNAIVTVRNLTTPEKCENVVSNQKDNGCFEVNETICNELDIPVTEVVTKVKTRTKNKKLKSPESESWWKTALTISYLKVTAPHHENKWKDKCDKAKEYLSKQIGDADVEKEILDCTDKFVVDNITKKVEKDHKKNVAITIIKESSSPEKCEEIVSNQKEDGSIELGDSICKELDTPKEEIITTIKKNITNIKLQLPDLSSSLTTAINISYLKNAASQHKGEWEDKYKKAREYLSNQIGDKDAEEELLECADKYVVDKVIDEHKKYVIANKKDEISKELKSKKTKSFFGGIYEAAAKLGDQIEDVITFNKDDHDDHEKAEALIIVEESASPEKCKEIISDQKDDGCIELSDSVCNELDAPKEEIISTIQKKINHIKLKSPEFSSSLATAINISYLKKAASQYEGQWIDKYNKAREYLSKQIGDANAEKELLECADNYVVENCTKKVIKDKKRNAIVIIRNFITPEKCEKAVSNQEDNGSFEVDETICKELDVPITEVVTKVKTLTKNKKLKPSESESWWKTALTISYLKAAAPHHENLWKDKCDKAKEYLSKQIGDADAEKEILDCTDKYVIDTITKKVEKDHKKNVAITIVQESVSPEKCREIVSNQKEDGSIELNDSVCKELDAPKEEMITTIKKNITNTKLQLPEFSSTLATALNLSYLKNTASQYKVGWEDKYNKAREYLSNQIGDKDAEELLECTDKYVIDKATSKVIEEHKEDVITLKKDEIPRELKKESKKESKKVLSFFGGIYAAAAKLGDQIEDTLTFNKDDHDDHEKAEALIVVEYSASPEKCKEIISDQKDDGCIELRQWIDKYNKAREYLSKQIGDANAEKELLECTGNYVVENCTKKVIKDKKRNAIVTVRNLTTPEKCEKVVSNQKDNGSFEIDETICNELDIPITKIVTKVKTRTKNKKLKSPESESWWKTALTISYLKATAPHHENKWKAKCDKAREYLSGQIGDVDAEKEILDCTDKYVVDNITKKVEKDHKKDVAISIIQESVSPEKCKEIASNQKEDGSIELGDSICKELDAPKEEIITTIKKNISNIKLQLPDLSSSLTTAINISYLKNAASQHKGEWEDKYNKACEYLSKQIGDKDAEKKLLECADEYVVDKITNKVIVEQKKDVISLKKDEIPKELKSKKGKSFFGGIYEAAAKLGDQIEDVITFNKDNHDDHEKAEALVIVEESASPEKCKEIISDQKDDGCIELNDSVCNELDAPKEEIISTIQKKISNIKLKSPEFSSSLATAINISYLKKAASQHKGEWVDQYNKAREYLSKQIGDVNAEKELLECADNYVVENCTKKVIKDKKRNAIVTFQNSTTPEKCEEILSSQKDDGSFEVNKTNIREEITNVKTRTKNKKLKSPESESWWKTALTISYLKVAAPHHENKWKDKCDKAREYLSKQIGDADAEKEILDCTDKYFVDHITKIVEKDHKKDVAISIIQESASPEKCEEIVSNQKEDGSIELGDSICKELDAPKEEIITTIQKNITNIKLQLPELSSSLTTAINLSYLKNAASQYKGEWEDKYNKAREYLSNQIGDKDAEEELLECADKYVIDKVIEEQKEDVIALNKIPKELKSKKGKSFFGGIYEAATKLGDQIEDALTFNKDDHDDHEKAEALVIVEESASPEKCEEILSEQKDDGCIELNDSVCNELDAPKEEIITTIQKKITNIKLKSPEFSSSLTTAINISYLKNAASKYEGQWIDKYNKAREYLSKQIGDANAEKELLECADNYVVENCTKKVIKDKKRNAIATVQNSTTPEKCEGAVANQKDNGSFEISDTVCKELDVPVIEVVTKVKTQTKNKKLKSPESVSWWKTALTISYLKVSAPHHESLWKDKCDKAREYLSKQIGDADIEKEILDCTDKYVVDNITKKVEKDHKQNVAITIIQESTSPEKCEEIVSNQKEDGSIELNDSVCKELDAPKEEMITTIKKNITNAKLQLPELSSSLATAINLSYLKNVASQYKGEWEDKYTKAREYLSNQIGDKDAEEELLECADKYVVDKATIKVIEEHKEDVISLKEDEIPKELNKEPKKESKKVLSFFGGIYEAATKLGDQIEDVITFNKDDHDDHEKAEALVIVEESTSPEKCEEILSDQKDDGCIELNDSVCNELDAPKEEIITSIQKKISNIKLKSPEFSSSLSTAINISYLKKAASQYEGQWIDKYNKAREYLSKQVGDANAEKELLECADNYVVENCTKKVIKDKKRNAIVTIQSSTTPEKCEDAVSNQNDNGSFEITETICKELDVPITEVVTNVKTCTKNKKLKPSESEAWWKTALTISYLKVTAPHHENLWKDKCDKAREYLSKQIGDADAEKEILDCTDKYVIDTITKKVEKDHKKNVAITIVQESVSSEKCKEIVSNQKEDGSIELDDSVCKELDTPKEEIITTIKKNITNTKLQLPELSSTLTTAINLSYLKNAASKYKGEWEDKYNKAREYLSNQIGDKDAEEELLECADKYVVNKVTNKVIEEKKEDVITLKKDEITRELKKESKKESKKVLSFFGGIYETAAKLGDQIEDALTFNKDNHDDHEKAEALIVVEESTSPEKCEEIISDQKDDGCIELSDSVCNELDVPKEEIITTIQKKITNIKLKSPEFSSSLATAINLSYLENAASKYEGQWIDKYNKAREYLSKQIGDADAEKELLDCADNYVVANCTKKVIKDKKRKAVVTVRNLTTPEKCENVVSNQKDNGSFEIVKTICEEIDIPVTEVVTKVKTQTKNKKLKSPESESWWKTALTISYLKVSAPHHENLWKDKCDKALKYLSEQIGDADIEKEILDCTDKYVVDNITKKVEKDHKKDVAITIINESTSPEKCREITSNQKEDGSIELGDSICKELDAPKEEIIDTIKKNISNIKLKLPDLSSSLTTAINISYLKNAASQHKGEWEDKYNKAREYLSNQISDKDAEEKLLECADKYVVDNITNKVIEEQKKDVITLKKIPKELESKKGKSFFGGIYEAAAKLGDQIEDALTFNKDDHDDHEKAEALVIVEKSSSTEKCKEILSDQKDDGCIKLSDSVCNELDAPKEEIITTIQNKISNIKLKSPEFSSSLATAINISYLKNAASQYKGEWVDKYNKAREYLSKQIGDSDAEKELLECTDNYVVENCTKKVIKDKKRNAVVTVQNLTTPEKCENAVSNQKDDGSFEVSETICNELDIPVTEVVIKVKTRTKNKKLKSPESESWWKTALTISYLKVSAPHHE